MKQLTRAESYQVCTKCVMDTHDPDITFDEQGVCCHCYTFQADAWALPANDEQKAEKLKAIVAEIKQAGQGKKYDCIVGLSGGVDSTYVAWKVKELGLRPLAVHFDNAWNSELAVKNIENIVKKLGIDLYTYVMDWDEFRDLQLSFLKASTPDAEIPTDHAIIAILLRVATEQGVRYLISGNNHATEGILPTSFGYGVFDWRYIKNVQKQFGSIKLKNYPHFSFLDRLYYIFFKKIKNVLLLNYLTYDKPAAMRLIQEKLGWVYYGGKHYESIYTRFFQAYILPRKFNVDKRRAHYSALILSGLMTRDEALEELKKETYPEKLLQEDREYVIKKLGLTEEQFNQIWELPVRRFSDYPTYEPFLSKTRKLVRLLKVIGVLPKRVGV